MHDARRIIFWRHGRTSWNAEQRFQGQTDIPLDEVGVMQAERAAGMLASLRPSRIICSDLLRTQQTAEPLARILALDITLDAGLRETFAGEWEGLQRDELEDGYGDLLQRWSAFADVRPGLTGETRLEVAERVVLAVERGLEQVAPGQALMVVTHGGAARAGIGAILGLPPDHWSALGVLTNCSWTVLQENLSGFGPAWRLQEYNAGTLPEAALADDR
ncbi:MAG: phosphoglycerate mutase family protein [Actinomycetales bacterium]|nr:phosphoglycerate mutase family protein [Actinomycetales bacterium]